jgi:hypothetical protein
MINRRFERSISCSVRFTSRIDSGGYLAARLPRAAKVIDYGLRAICGVAAGVIVRAP